MAIMIEKKHNSSKFTKEQKLQLKHDTTKYLAEVLVNVGERREEFACDQDTYRHLNTGISRMMRESSKQYSDLKSFPNDYNQTYSQFENLFDKGSFSNEQRTQTQKEFVKKSVNGLKRIMDKYTEAQKSLSHLPSDYKKPGSFIDEKNGPVGPVR